MLVTLNARSLDALDCGFLGLKSIEDFDALFERSQELLSSEAEQV